MLIEFIREHRAALIERTRAKVRARSAPRPRQEEIESGVPLFLTQFTDLLASTTKGSAETRGIGESATLHGQYLLKRGFTIAQVVHDYGDICQAVTELAVDLETDISSRDFNLLNLCLDNAIAEAVTEYSRQREENLAGEELERLGYLAHELRNLTSTASLAFQFLRGGTVGIAGSTGDVLARSLAGLRDLVDRSLVRVRLTTGQQLKTRILLAEFIEEIEAAAALDAKARNLRFTVEPVAYGYAVEADRQLLASAVTNLLQNAFKFTRREGHVTLRTRIAGATVLIEVEDECGGLPPGKQEVIFQPFEQHGPDRSGLGLGLTITRESVTANDGRISARDLPGKGCIFTIELALAASMPVTKA